MPIIYTSVLCIPIPLLSYIALYMSFVIALFSRLVACAALYRL